VAGSGGEREKNNLMGRRTELAAGIGWSEGNARASCRSPVWTTERIGFLAGPAYMGLWLGPAGLGSSHLSKSFKIILGSQKKIKIILNKMGFYI
jgi:hypothetical protein